MLTEQQNVRTCTPSRTWLRYAVPLQNVLDTLNAGKIYLSAKYGAFRAGQRTVMTCSRSPDPAEDRLGVHTLARLATYTQNVRACLEG